MELIAAVVLMLLIGVLAERFAADRCAGRRCAEYDLARCGVAGATPRPPTRRSAPAVAWRQVDDGAELPVVVKGVEPPIVEPPITDQPITLPVPV